MRGTETPEDGEAKSLVRGAPSAGDIGKMWMRTGIRGTGLAGILMLTTLSSGENTLRSQPSLPASGLRAHWGFEEKTWIPNTPSVRDGSGNECRGTPRGKAKPRPGGKPGRCAGLAGPADFIEVPNAAVLNPSRLTLMAWFWPERDSLQDQKFVVLKSFTSHRRPYYQYGLALMDRAGRSRTITFYAAVDGGFVACGATRVQGDFYDGWHHLAGTFDGQDLKIYFDGRLLHTERHAGTLSSFDTPLLIGAYANLPKTPAYGFAGRIDEVAIWDRALSAVEIQDCFRAANPDLLLRFPGTGPEFGKICDDRFSAETFTALASRLLGGSLWLSEPNDDEVLIQVRAASPDGELAGAASLSAGPAGRRGFEFRPPVILRRGAAYCLKALAGAPGTKSGAVQRQAPNPRMKGFTEDGESPHDMALELFFRGGGAPVAESRAAGRPGSPEDIAYERRLNEALLAKRDLWGEALMARPEGPTYDNVKDLLRPMMRVGDYVTASGVHYVVFGEPAGITGGGDCALHVADGSEIISRYHKTGRRTTFFVGEKGEERFGFDLERLREPRLFDGYQPVLLSEYRDRHGVLYRQESFAAPIPETESLVSFIRFRAESGETTAGETVLRIQLSEPGLEIEGNRLLKGGKCYLLFTPGARYEEPFLSYRLDPRAAAPNPIHLVRLNQPAPCAEFVPGEERFAAARAALCRDWDERLAGGALIEVPEERVMHAMRNLLIQNLFMTWRYSIGNAYESWYPHESGDTLRSLAEYGFQTHYRDNLQVLIPRIFRGEDERMMEWGQKLYYIAHYTLLTRDRSLVDDNRPRLRAWLDGMIAKMDEDPNGLLGRTRAGDIHTQRYYSNHEANGWRALRDMAVVYAKLGYEEESSLFAAAAQRLKRAFFVAFDAAKAELPDGSLFFPKVLVDNLAEPYEVITDTRLGSYWNLSISTSFRSGILDPRGEQMRKALLYLSRHGGRFLGLTRFNYYPVPVGQYREGGLPGYSTSGADNVYGLGIVEALAEQDQADQIVLSLYGKLAHGMTRGTFIAGEGDAYGVVPGEYYRSLYLPPSNTNNALFLKTLHDMLVFNQVDAEGEPDRLLLAHFTPRAWLENGKEIRVTGAPTLFGEVSFHIASHLERGVIQASVQVPGRNPPRGLFLRLRTPGAAAITRVVVNGTDHTRFDGARETIDLSGRSGSLAIRVEYAR